MSDMIQRGLRGDRDIVPGSPFSKIRPLLETVFFRVTLLYGYLKLLRYMAREKFLYSRSCERDMVVSARGLYSFLIKYNDMMKIYQTRLGNLSTSVDVNGVLRRVQFLASDGVNGIFSTADEQLQRAMENSRGYGRRFKLSDVAQPASEEKIYTLVPEVRSWQDARDYLRREPYGLSDEEVSSPALIEQAAERLNLIFSQLKKRNKR